MTPSQHRKNRIRHQATRKAARRAEKAAKKARTV